MLNQKERLTDSVKAITEKCKEMCKDAEEYKLVSLHDTASIVMDSLDKLSEEFDKGRYDELKLSLLKESVERNAIILEYHLQSVSSKYREIYNLRCYVEDFVEKVTAKQKAIAMKVIEGDIVLWSMYGQFAIKIKRRSMHVIFSLLKDDRDMLSEIEKELSE